MSEWPTWATEPVRIEDWSPVWAEHAAELIDSLQDVLDGWITGPIHHVGSTAVPDLPAKPVIDLLATVPSIADATSAHGVLDNAGWSLVPPELDERPWRRMYVLPEGDRRIAHLHLVDASHERARDTLMFRDRLREDAELANRYAQLKKAAAKAHHDDREAYTAAKSDFVRKSWTQRRSRASRRASQWLRARSGTWHATHGPAVGGGDRAASQPSHASPSGTSPAAQCDWPIR